MPQGQTTPERTLSNPWSGKGFCEPQQYKSAIDRAEGGYHSLDVGIDMYKRLHKIFESHSANLREWSKSSIKQIADSKESGTNKKAWMSSVRTVEKLTERNDTIAKGVQEKVIDGMTSFKNQHYGKSFRHVRQIKDFEKEFKKVQETWTDCLEKINRAKQSYHEKARKLHAAENAEKVTRTDAGSSEEDKEKADASVQRRRVDAKSYKSKYESVLDDAAPKQKKYEEDMLAILKRTDEFEKKRLEHYKSIIESLREATLIKHDEFDTKMTKAFTEAAKEHNSEEDIQFFNTHYGSERKTVWPAFEEWKL